MGRIGSAETKERINRLESGWISYKFGAARKELLGEGITQKDVFGAEAKTKIIGLDLEVVGLPTYEPDFPFEITTDQWIEKIDSFAKDKSMDEVFTMIDGVLIVESRSRVEGTFDKKENYRKSIENFDSAVKYRYGAKVTDEWIRDKFSDRMEVFDVGFNGDKSYLSSLGIQGDNWQNRSGVEKMKLIYGSMGFNFSEANTTRDVVDLSKLAKEVPRMLPEVYKEFREGGFEKGRPGIEVFDGAVGWLMRERKLILNANGYQPELKKDDDYSARVLRSLRDMASNWANRKGEITTEQLLRELFASIERWSMNYEMAMAKTPTTSLFKYFASAASYNANYGGRWGLGLILTEKTRESKKSDIKKKYHEKARKFHPDTIEGDKSGDNMRKTNEIYEILSSKEKFAKLSGGW